MHSHALPPGIVALLVGLLALPAAAVAAPPLTATVEFGQPDTGSPFPPSQQHDQSSHAKDNLVPRTVVIAAGGTVTFRINTPAHASAIYQSGTEPEDIDVTIIKPSAGPPCPPPPLIDDAEGRLAVFAQPCAGGQSVVNYTFQDPGRYLVICIFFPHFVDFDMYGWVIVEPGD
jgi:plastocyanin